MAKLSIVAGATSQTVNLFILDNSKTDGSGLTGLAYNSGGLIAYYSFPRTAAAAISLATLAAANSAYSSGGFKEIDSTNMPGLYRFDVPNAVLASGNGRFVTIMLSGATHMPPTPLEIELTGWDNQLGSGGRVLIASAPIKNTAFAKFPFDLVDSNGNPAPGISVTAQRSIDGGAWGACSNSPVDTGNGSYSIDLSAADLNGNAITLYFTGAGAQSYKIDILTNA